MLKVLLVSLLVTAVLSADDGQYRPERYRGDDGKYRTTHDGRYYGDTGAYRPYIAETLKYKPLKFTSPFGSNNVGFSRTPIEAKSSFGSFGKYSSQSSSETNHFVNRFVVDSASSNLSPRRLAVKSFPSSPEASSRILKQDTEINPDAYHYSYDTENNIRAAESGRLENVNTDREGIKASGFYEYVGPDNIKYRVDYIADENGFQPIGKHLPVPNIARYLIKN